MSDDIVDRLRHVAWLAEEGSEVTDLAASAADEIVRLRERVTELEAERAALHDAGDCLVDALTMLAAAPATGLLAKRAATLKWLEVTRG